MPKQYNATAGSFEVQQDLIIIPEFNDNQKRSLAKMLDAQRDAAKKIRKRNN